MGIFLGIIAGIGTIFFLVLLHELGHFVVAKLSNAYVYEFAIGFGPTLFKIKGKETWFTFRLIPLGGYNYIASSYVDPPRGRENEEVPEERKINSINHWKRAAFILCGPFVNIIIALFIFSISLTITKMMPNDANFYGATYSSTSLKLLQNASKVNKNTQTYQQDLTLIGMRLITFENNKYKIIFSSISNDISNIDHNDDDYDFDRSNIDNKYVFSNIDDHYAKNYLTTVYSFIDQIKYIQKYKNDDITFKIQLGYKERNSYTSQFKSDNKLYYTKLNNSDSNYMIGFNIGISSPTRYFKTSGQAYWYGWKETFVQCFSMLKAIGQLFIGNVKSISGPIGIVKTAELSLNNFQQYLIFVASISSNLFMFNMLFIPPLDGYRLIENIYESIWKKEINDKIKVVLYAIGTILILLLIILSTIIDLIR